MRHENVRVDTIDRRLSRFRRRQLEREDREKIDEIVADAVDHADDVLEPHTKPGDTRRLRGIPICMEGVRGTQAGTDPFDHCVRVGL